MPIYLIDKIKPKNNGSFPMLDAVDVQLPDNNRLSDLFVAAEPVLAEQGLSGFTEQSNGAWLLEVPVVLALTEGAAYQVIWDGETYFCKQRSEIAGDTIDLGSGSYLGNGNIFMETLEDTGEPFFVICGTGSTIVVTREAGERHRVSLSVGGHINPAYLPKQEENASGFPEVTTDDNGKIMQVVDGAWTAIAVADSAVATFVDDYISSALEGDY